MITTDISDRTTVGAGAIAEYDAFADLLDSLSDEDWRTASRCEGFDVRDVAGHVVGLAEDTAAGVPGSRTAAEEAATVRDDAPAVAAQRLRAATGSLRALMDAIDDEAWAGPSGVPDLTLGRGVLTLWYDTYVHADDIRAALGRPSERGPGLDASIAYLVSELELRNFGPLTVDIDDDPLQFVLVATGRADAATLGLDDTVNIYRA